MSRIRSSYLIFASTFFLSVITTAQTDPTFKAKTEVVVVPTLVRDANGTPISGLKKEDFVVLEDGKPQAIAFFEETQTSIQVKPEQPTPGEYTNALQQDPSQKRMTIIVLDMLNTSFADQTYARQQLLKFLEQSLDVREPTALFTLGRKGLNRIHDFTGDTKALLVALRVLNGESPKHQKAQTSAELGLSRETIAIYALPKPTSLGDPAWEVTVSDPFIKEISDNAERLLVFRNGDGDYSSVQDRITVGQTLAAMQQIAHAYEGVPGRKSLIWATGGFPFDITASGALQLPSIFSTGTAATPLQASGKRYDSSGAMPSLPESSTLLQGNDMAQLIPVYERTLQLLTHANVAVYPIDARGLVAFSTDATRENINTGLTQDLRGQQFSSQTSMEGMANATGGKAFYNRNDLSTGFKSAAEDGTKYYTLGYYRDRSQKAGWHKIEVTVKQPGLRVRSRRGYIVPRTAVSSKTTRQLDVATAVAAPFSFTGIPFFVKWKAQTPDKKGKTKVEFDMWIPPDKGGATDEFNLEILAGVQDAKGQIIDQMGQVLGKDMKPEMIAQIRQQGIAYNNQLFAPPGKYKVKFIVRDNLTGRLGSLQVPLDVN